MHEICVDCGRIVGHCPNLEHWKLSKKRLTDTELAAEYHQQAAYNAYWIDRATIAAVRRNEDRLATLHRFATLPSYDQEDNDV